MGSRLITLTDVVLNTSDIIRQNWSCMLCVAVDVGLCTLCWGFVAGKLTLGHKKSVNSHSASPSLWAWEEFLTINVGFPRFKKPKT